MRRKFSAHGMSVFETYELIEMLLYNTVPVKNTNPLAKAILSAFSGVEGVLSATREDLTGVDGVGNVTAGMFVALGRIKDHCFDGSQKKRLKFGSYTEIGEFVLDCFNGISKDLVISLCMDSDMNLLGVDKLYSIDYASGGVRAQRFLDAVLHRSGSQVVIAHNHPFGSVFPSEGDIQTNIMIENALGSVDVQLVEHYIVCGDSCMGFMRHAGEILKRTDGRTSVASAENVANGDEVRLLSDFLSVIDPKSASNAAASLINTFGTIGRVLRTDEYALAAVNGCSKTMAFALRLASAIISRSVTDKYKIGNKCLHIDIKPYVCSLFFGSSVEKVILISIDKNARLLGYDIISEGTVNFASFTPRKILETVLRRSADRVIMAHNHPSGDLTTSREDIDATEIVASVLNSAGITLINHYIVSDMMTVTVPIDYNKYRVFKASPK